VVSTLALIIGLIVGEVVQPGVGFNIDPRDAGYQGGGELRHPRQGGGVRRPSARDHSPPDSFFGALARGDLLQVLLVSILTGFALTRLGEGRASASPRGSTMPPKMFFTIIGIVVRVAPIGAFGAMAFTVGAFGVGSLWKLIELIVVFYATSIIFVLLVLGTIAYFAGLLDSALHCLHQGRIADRGRHILVRNRAAADDPEDAAPRCFEVGSRAGDPDRLQLQPRRHQHLHDARDIVSGAGDQYASDDLAGARHPRHCHRLPLEGGLGRSPGAGFVTLAATLAIVPDIPIQSLAILVGIDKFMSECPRTHQPDR